MSSSDSDDCYGNMAQKLQSLNDQYVYDKIFKRTEPDANSVSLMDTNLNTHAIEVKDLNTILNTTDEDDLTLDAIKTKKATTSKRGRKRKVTNSSSDSNAPLASKRTTRQKTAKSKKTTGSNEDIIVVGETLASRRGRRRVTDCEASEDVVPDPPLRGRGRPSRGSTLATANSENTTENNEDIIVVGETSTSRKGRGRVMASEDVVVVPDTPPRGRGRASRGSTPATDRGRGGSQRGRGRGATPRGRGRGRNRRNTPATDWVSSVIYSIGNTDEYPDMSDNQQLFSTNPSKSNEVEIIDDKDPLANDNEELSVKVYWQNLEVVRFKIRKYQKLSPIFKYFAERENIGADKLLFMYNDRILKSEDTPDTMGYSIAKFIDGGIVERGVEGLIRQNSGELKKGIRIKFQCQDAKKPFEITVGAEEQLALPMIKCAEHWETPLETLKFYFDGEEVPSKNTPKDLELEGGECIDVKITS